ncbi:hypothetical protein SDC9_183217 [bioreactor metagenome]|uniref:Uncharacterized protein n=1 Tax=bioreactor metagenome TaxID=1076179 RepID=A0A645HC75_9ZZZZ
MLGRREYTPRDLEIVRKIMTDCGPADAVRSEGMALVEQAKSILKEFPANVYRRCLTDLVDYLIDREK